MKIGWIAALAGALVAVLFLWNTAHQPPTHGVPALPPLLHGDGAAPGEAPVGRAAEAARRDAADDEPDDGGPDTTGDADTGQQRDAAPAPGDAMADAAAGGNQAPAMRGDGNRPAPAPPIGPGAAAGASQPQASGDDGANGDPNGEPLYELVFDGGGERVFPSDSQEEVAARSMPGSAGTVQFWIMPQWDPGNQDAANLIQLGDSGMEIVKEGDSLRFRFHDSAGNDNSVETSIADWPANQWRNVTGTWLGSTLTLFVDGHPVAQNTFDTNPDFPHEMKVIIGSAFASGDPAARAALSGVRILNSNMPDAKVAEFVQGGAPHITP